MADDIVDLKRADEVSQNVVFTTSLNFSHHSGTVRVPVDLASGVADKLGVSPTFVHDESVMKYLRMRPDRIVVGINFFPDEEECSEFRGRILDIRMNDTRPMFDKADDLRGCDVFLNPHFRQVPSRTLSRVEGLTVINYSLLPSRMARTTHDTADVKTIAVYFRNAGKEAARRLREVMIGIRKKKPVHFMVSTGPATQQRMIYYFEEKFANMPMVETFIYNNMERKSGAQVLDDYFARADAIIVSDDSVSTLSDAVKTGAPTFLLMDPVRHEMVVGNHPNAFAKGNANHAVQALMMAEDRLRPLTAEAVLSEWQPPYKDEWADISAKLADMARQRLTAQQSLGPAYRAA